MARKKPLAEEIVDALLWSMCDGTFGDPKHWIIHEQTVGDLRDEMIAIVKRELKAKSG